jgi:hypothetical protein
MKQSCQFRSLPLSVCRLITAAAQLYPAYLDAVRCRNSGAVYCSTLHVAEPTPTPAVGLDAEAVVIAASCLSPGVTGLPVILDAPAVPALPHCNAANTLVLIIKTKILVQVRFKRNVFGLGLILRHDCLASVPVPRDVSPMLSSLCYEC